MNHGIFSKPMRADWVLLATLISAILFIACRPPSPAPFKMTTTNHATEGYTVDTMTGNQLGGEEGYALNAARYSAKDGAVKYALGVRYHGEQWMFIEPGVSLILLIDGQRLGLKGQGSLRDRKSFDDGHVRETAKYPVSPELLKKMAAADNVEIHIIGRNFVAKVFFTSRNFENFRGFVDTYLK
jgi:hypothetical protein